MNRIGGRASAAQRVDIPLLDTVPSHCPQATTATPVLTIPAPSMHCRFCPFPSCCLPASCLLCGRLPHTRGARTRPPRLRVVLVPAPCPCPGVLLLVCYSYLARALLVPTRARATLCLLLLARYSFATRPLLVRYS